MSAWIVSKTHIDYMVTAIIRAELWTGTPDELGSMLWCECLESVAYLYPNNTGDGDRPGPADFSDIITYTWAETPELTPGGLAKTLACYEYQSCETPTWEKSEAYAITSKLRESLGDVKYDETVPWGWD